MTTRSYQAQTASLIKKDLQAKYPLIKFSVKSDMYSVRARWTDGPTAHDVEQVMNPYTNGSFDGMTDCFNYTKSAKPVSVNYVFADRDYSKEARDTMRAKLAKEWRITNTADEDALPDRPYGMWTMGQFINHELHALDLYPKPAPQEDRHVARIISDILDDLAQPEEATA